MSLIRLINKQNFLVIHRSLLTLAVKSNSSIPSDNFESRIFMESKFNSFQNQTGVGDLPSNSQSVANFSTMSTTDRPNRDVAGGEPGISKNAEAAGGDPGTSKEPEVKGEVCEGRKSNALLKERSPYLRQHAYNPVDWHPWGEEAFQKAEALNKPVFLSIGYSTCHWCHVMERESFECEDTAKALNEDYVCVKVDREERPDVDKIYMSYVQRTTGTGGWPLSLFLTPKLQPLFGGTYFPPDRPDVKVGFKALAQAVAKQWRVRHRSLDEEASSAITLLKVAVQQRLSYDTRLATKDAWLKCYHQLSRSYELEFGGFTQSPKFPQPCIFNFLLAMYYKYSTTFHGAESLEMCLYTMKKMAKGGIHDHVGSGFSRYSVDKKWHVPHFEKMLYDQAQIVCSYVDAYMISRDEFYANIVHDVLKYVGRDLSHKLGGFYGAEDADSYPTFDSKEKKEGAFYAWTYDEIKALITDKSDFALFCFYMNVRHNGNVPANIDPHQELANKNVLGCFVTDEEASVKFELTVDEVKKTVERCLVILYEARKSRPRPDVDTKILTAWNGLMISGYAKAGFALKNSDYIDRAVLAATFVKENLCTASGTLLRCCYGDAQDLNKIVHSPNPIGGFLDDYAFFIKSLIDLYEATLDTSWLEWAEDLQNMQNELFWDEKFNAYFVSSTGGDRYVMYRDKEDQDGAEPAANSVTAQNLIRLSSYLERKDFHELARKTLSAYTERLNIIPYALPEMAAALMLYYSSPTQVFIAGKRDHPDTQELLDVVRKSFVPGRLLAIVDGPEGKSKLFYDRHLSVKHLKPLKGKPTVYVCKNFACALPVTDPEELANNLKGDAQKHDLPGDTTSDSDRD